ncbi:MAG: GtrA family protein [Ruminococcaceae bacterium]|nr:GtrA family protein [Oscillospiraceae bacterium]
MKAKGYIVKFLEQHMDQFIKFGLVGVSNTLISYVTYAVLVYFGVQYVFANVIAFVISVLNSFYWNNKFVFKKEKDETRSVFRSLLKTFISYASTGLILANFLLLILVEKFKISKYLAPVFILVVTIPLNFLLNKFWAFKTQRKRLVEENEENKCSDCML